MRNSIITTVIVALSVGTAYCGPHRNINATAHQLHLNSNATAVKAHEATGERARNILSNTMTNMNAAHQNATTEDEHKAIEEQRQQFLSDHRDRTQTAHQNIEAKNTEVHEAINEAATQRHQNVEHVKVNVVEAAQQTRNAVTGHNAHVATSERAQTAFQKGMDYFNSCHGNYDESDEDSHKSIEEQRQQFIANHNEKTQSVHQAINEKTAEVRNTIHQNAVDHHQAIEGYEEETTEAAETVEEGF